MKTMKALNWVYLFIIALVLAGCSTQRKQELMEQELLETDLAFSEMSGEEGMNKAFTAFCADEGVLLRRGTMPIVGRAAIGEVLNRNDDAAFDLTWEPLFARVSKCGDLGYTYGLYTLSMKIEEASSRGTYVSVWTRESGTWKWVLDSGNEGLAE